MPSGITDWGATAWISALLGIDADIIGYYVALLTDQPGVDSDGTIVADLEPTVGGYARQAYGVGDVNWAADGGFATNLIEIDFGTCSADWGFLPYYALLDSLTDGEIYAFGEFLNPAYIGAGDPVVIPPGGIILGMASQQDSIAI